MKHFRLKIALTVIFAIGLAAAFSWIVTWQNYKKLSEDAIRVKPSNREAVRFTLDNLAAAWNDYEAKIVERYTVNADFASLALSNVDVNENTMPREAHENSAVVAVEKGALSAPESVRQKLGLDVSLFHGRTGHFAAPGEPSTFVVYSRIAQSNHYYVEWYENTVLQNDIAEIIDIPTILKRTEITYDMPALFLACDPGSADGAGILYKNNWIFEACNSLEDMGLSREDLENTGESASEPLTLGDAKYTYIAEKSQQPAGYVILLEPVPNLYAKALGQTGYMIAALIVTLTALLVAGFSLYPYVENNILTPEEEKNHHPARVRSFAVLFGLYGIIIIALCGMFGYSLNGLYDDTAREKNRLGMIETSIREYSERYQQNNQAFRDVYQEFGNHIGLFLDRYPELRSSAVLDTLAESISASYITLYDSNGRETVSSGPWVGLELGKDPDSSTYDFRRILKGVPSILKDPEPDEQTGLNELRLGIRIQEEPSGGKYGAMLINIDIAALAELDTDPQASIRGILQILSDAGTEHWIADAKSGRILVSNDKAVEGKTILDIGLKESDLRGDLVRTLNTEAGSFLITSASMAASDSLKWADAEESVIIYSRKPDSLDVSDMLRSCLTGCLLFCVIYSILAFIVLTEYTEAYFIKAVSDRASKADWQAPQSIIGRMSAVSPAKKGLIALEFITALILLLMIPVTRSSAFVTQNSVYYYILSDKWERGFNLFAAAGILLLMAEITLFVIAARFLTAIVSSLSGPRGKTICRLIESCILYMSLFGFFIKTCEYLGFSREMIVTGVGALALAISLGAQNFVSDVIAGLTFVFEGSLHVGDFVQISIASVPIFQGTVTEIGVRTIKLLTRDGDMIATCNRDVKVIRNYTQMNSRVICKLTVSSACSSEEIEQMLKKELPNVSRGDQRILRGPVYNGITAIADGRMILSVSAECREEDVSYVRDKLNGFLQRIFREHGYDI